MKKSVSFFLTFFVVILVVISACVKDEPEPENPYDDIDYGQIPVVNDTVNPTSLLGLHRNIFSVRCAVPGCHDGHFEPDFRTVQSTYSTLVYSPVIKNNEQNEFSFRVVPGNPAMSVLHERITNCCFVNEDDRMPQDNIGVPLQQNLIDNITTWIQNGAKNENGESETRPDLEPVFPYYYAASVNLLDNYSSLSYREDSLFYNPFRVPPGTASFYFVAEVEDDITPIAGMQINKLLLSTTKDNFSSAVEFTGVFIPGDDAIWLITVNTSLLTPGQIYYMRYYVNDGHHSQNTEFPKTDSQDLFKTYWSFFVQP